MANIKAIKGNAQNLWTLIQKMINNGGICTKKRRCV